MPWDWPVEVNCFEASAYCRWLSKKNSKTFRLPSEDEYYSMLKHIEICFKAARNNLALVHTSPTPID